MTTAYTTGTVTLTNGSLAVVGVGTAWALALISGGVIFVQSATGNVLPIATVVDNTHITASLPWQGASGSYSYALLPDTSYDRQVLANATALAQIIQGLQKPSVNALAGLTPAADKLPYFTGSNTAALVTLSSFIRTLLDDADAATARTTLGAGDMLKATYDPQNLQANAFSRGNHTGDLPDSVLLANVAASTKKARFDLSSIASGNTRILSIPDRSFTISPAWEQIGQAIDMAGVSYAIWNNLSRLIRVLIDQNPSAHSLRPMDMIRQGWLSSLRQALQQWATISS